MNFRCFSCGWLLNGGFKLVRGILRVIWVLANNLYCFPTHALWMLTLYPLQKCKPNIYWKIEGIIYHWMISMVGCWSWTAGYNGKWHPRIFFYFMIIKICISLFYKYLQLCMPAKNFLAWPFCLVKPVSCLSALLYGSVIKLCGTASYFWNIFLRCNLHF